MSRVASWVRDPHRGALFAPYEFKLMGISDFDPYHMTILIDTIKEHWGRVAPLTGPPQKEQIAIVASPEHKKKMVDHSDADCNGNGNGKRKRKRKRRQRSPCDSYRPNEIIPGILPMQKVVTTRWIDLCVQAQQLLPIEAGWYQSQTGGDPEQALTKAGQSTNPQSAADASTTLDEALSGSAASLVPKSRPPAKRCRSTLKASDEPWFTLFLRLAEEYEDSHSEVSRGWKGFFEYAMAEGSWAAGCNPKDFHRKYRSLLDVHLPPKLNAHARPQRRKVNPLAGVRSGTLVGLQGMEPLFTEANLLDLDLEDRSRHRTPSEKVLSSSWYDVPTVIATPPSTTTGLGMRTVHLHIAPLIQAVTLHIVRGPCPISTSAASQLLSWMPHPSVVSTLLGRLQESSGGMIRQWKVPSDLSLAADQSVGTRDRVVLRPWWVDADNGDEADAEKQGPRKSLAAVFLYDLRSARGGILHMTHDRGRRHPSDISSLASAWTAGVWGFECWNDPRAITDSEHSTFPSPEHVHGLDSPLDLFWTLCGGVDIPPGSQDHPDDQNSFDRIVNLAGAKSDRATPTLVEKASEVLYILFSISTG